MIIRFNSQLISDMDKNKIKQAKKERRKGRVRVKISGTEERPRLSVFRSNRGMYVQLIDDNIGQTMASASSKEIDIKKLPKTNRKTALSLELGKLLAQKAAAKGIKGAVFDRNGYKYHGRVKALAEGVRKGGLKF